MESLAAWAGNNWFDLLQSFGIVASVLLSTWAIKRDHRSRMVQNRLTITEHHRDLWRQLSENPELRRILRRDIDLRKAPVTPEEEQFVTLAILHLNAHFYAAGQKLIVKPEGLPADIESFFTLPIPRQIWNQTRHLRDRKFADFVERVLKDTAR